jgi:hypothetical protein
LDDTSVVEVPYVEVDLGEQEPSDGVSKGTECSSGLDSWIEYLKKRLTRR